MRIRISNWIGLAVLVATCVLAWALSPEAGIALAALPYVLDFRVTGISPWPGTGVNATSEWAVLELRKAVAETAADEIMDGEQSDDQPIRIRIHQAQKADFTVGDLITGTFDTTP